MEISSLFRKLDINVPVREILISNASEDELKEISDIMAIGLSTEEMIRIRDHFLQEGREPTDIELEALGQAWSEHCCYKSSKYFMKRSFIGIEAPQTVLEGEDAGVVEFDDRNNVLSCL
jgi:phosphoribosylformylglycinamidine synthase